MHSKKGLMKVAAITGLALVMTTGIAMASIGTGTVTADALRLRSQANTNSSILTLAPHNSVVTLLEELDGWYKVSYGDQVGYMSADWLDVTGSVHRHRRRPPCPLRRRHWLRQQGPGVQGHHSDHPGGLRQRLV